MPEMTMECVPYNSVIKWYELVQLLSRLNEPLKVEVTDTDDDVVEASPGDELIVGQVNMDRYAVSAVSDYDEKAVWTGEASSNETIRSAKIPTHFRLFPRRDKDHCFRSVREIIETLPAVYKLIFTIDGFQFSGKYVKPKERLEMLDLVRDSATGSRLLLVKSVKTGMEITLNEKMEAPFFQLPSDCYKCSENGISASDLLAYWTPGQSPFIVKYLSPAKEVHQADLEKKFIGGKPNKKNKHRVKLSKPINDCQSTPHVQDCFPQHLQDRRLFFRPYYAATVQNITRDQDDMILSENSKLTVRILPSSKRSRSAQSSVTSGHSLSSPSASADSLQDIISKVNWRTTTFLITGGEMATTLRELDYIRKGHRIAVLMIENKKKAVLVGQRNEMFLVGTAYGGKFTCDLVNSRGISAEEICEILPPIHVEVIAKDEDIGYDQLHIGRSFKVTAIVTEWTAYVEVFGSDGQKLSHHPFEIPLCRKPLHAKADEPISIFQTLSLSKAKYVVKLPVVEMVTKDDVDAIQSYWKPEDVIPSHQKYEAGIRSYQGAVNATRGYPRPEVGVRRSLGPDDEIFRSHRRIEEEIRNYHGLEDAITSYQSHGLGIRRSLGPDDDIFRSHQILEDGIRNYHAHDDATPSYRRLENVLRSYPMPGDRSPNYHGHDDVLRSYMRMEDGMKSVFNFENVQAASLEINPGEEIFSPDSLYTKFNKMNSQPSTSDVPPPRPPKSPALRRHEYERLQGTETVDELLRLEITDAPVSPQRPPKPDRFKSPHHEFSSNNNNNISRHDGAAVVSTVVGVQSKQDEIEICVPVSARRSLQDNLKSTAIEVTPAELIVNPKEKRAGQSSFEILHESYNPWTITDENSITNSYELLANANSSNLPASEYATYVNPSLLHKKHTKVKSARTIPNPNYEDSIQVTMISQQNDYEGQLNVTVNEANSHFHRRNAAKNFQPSDYSFADNAKDCRGIRETILKDDNLDYEDIPEQSSEKHPNQGLMTNQDEDYEVAVYEEMSH